MHNDVPKKANHVLHLILIAFLLVLVRVWYLGTVKHEEYLTLARKPQKRTVVESALRGTIRDRFNLPLAINKIQYNACICYDEIREIPSVKWSPDKNNKRIKVHARKEYINKLVTFLGSTLEIDPIEIEDIIYSKASIFPYTSFVIKENLEEATYYKLRMSEKDWVGLRLEKYAKRFYPHGKVASNILGYIGPINQNQYGAIAHELSSLDSFIKEREDGLPIPLPKGFNDTEAVKCRYNELLEKAYTINAFVGKMGIERKFDESLRGFYGKKQIEIGAKGKSIRTLPSSTKAISGQRFILSISLELQDFAESLLSLSEKDREEHFPLAGKDHSGVLPPWIKGGAIVAMIPQTGEVVALATYPRFDPNDFTPTTRGIGKKGKNASVNKWLESKQHIRDLWNGKYPLEREFFSFNSNSYSEEAVFLTWDLFLDRVLSLKGKVRQAIKNIAHIKSAIESIRLCEELVKLSNQKNIYPVINLLYPELNGNIPSHLKCTNTELEKISKAFEANKELVEGIKHQLQPLLAPIKHNDDKLLLFDLLRVCLNPAYFSDELLEKIGDISLSQYFTLTQIKTNIEEELKEEVYDLYHKHVFSLWRKEHFKNYLKTKREEEKEKKTYEHPYTKYLAEAKATLFSEFWNQHRFSFLQAYLFGKIDDHLNSELRPFLFHLLVKRGQTSPLQQSLKPLGISFLKTMREFSMLNEPLWGHYYQLHKIHGEQTTNDLASFFYPKNGFGYTKSFAYSEAAPQGSIFKIVTAYEALKQIYDKHSTHHLPFLDLNPLTIYDEMNANITTENGIILGRALDGSLITRHYKGGRLPRSHVSIGKVDLKTAIERSSNIYFSLLASDVIDHPASLQKTTELFGFGRKTGIDLISETSGCIPNDLRDNKTSLYSFAIGQHSLTVTPLQTAVMFSALANGGEIVKPQIAKLKVGVSHGFEPTVIPFDKIVKDNIFLNGPIRDHIFGGLYRVVWGEKGGAGATRIRSLYQYPKMLKNYKNLQDQFIGKTSTAEILYRPTLDRESSPILCKDIWFGAISFKEKISENSFDAEPELVVIVYLRSGDFGKEAAPLAAEMIKKWREIQLSH